MKTLPKKVSDMTVDGFKSVNHEVITKDMDAWWETFEITEVVIPPTLQRKLPGK